MFKVTKEWIDAHKTPGGGHSAAQLRMLGLGFPLRAGWKDRSAGKHITFAEKQAFEAGAISKSQARKLARASKKKARVEKQVRFVEQAEKVGYAKAAESRMQAMVAQSGINPVSDAFLLSFEWRAVRMQALKKHGARCQCCGATPADGVRMNVDHIKPRKLFPQLALELSNLQVLCEECNHGKGNWDCTDWRHAHETYQTELDELAEQHLRSMR